MDDRRAEPGLTLPQVAAEIRRRYSLSARQEQILALMVSGRSNQEIAAELGIDFRTVSEHTARTCAKLAVIDRAALAARFLEITLELAKEES